MKNVFLALENTPNKKKMGNDIPDKLLNSESKHRKRQVDTTSRCDNRSQRTHLRLNPPYVYSVGENVFVRLRGRAWNKRHVTEARIEEKNIKLHTYKVAYTSPLTGKKERKEMVPCRWHNKPYPTARKTKAKSS